jgi:hypothetical protein
MSFLSRTLGFSSLATSVAAWPDFLFIQQDFLRDKIAYAPLITREIRTTGRSSRDSKGLLLDEEI